LAGKPSPQEVAKTPRPEQLDLSRLPDFATAKLPAVYQQATASLEKCVRIDECADWANKAQALASYARQAKDDELRKAADQIQARAVRRCGELLKEIESASGARTDLNQPRSGAGPRLKPQKQRKAVGTKFGRAQAARAAGMSPRQQKTALQVASIPKAEFEAAVESENPPTVTELARRGTKPSDTPAATPRWVAREAAGRLRKAVDLEMTRWGCRDRSALAAVLESLIKSIE
jgi:hypothetical protein